MRAAAPANNTRKKQGGKRSAGARGGTGWGHWDGDGTAQRPPCCSRHSCAGGVGTVCTQSPLPLGLPPDGPEERGAEGGDMPRCHNPGKGPSHPSGCPHPWGVPGALLGCSASPVRMLDHHYWSAHQFPPGCSVHPSGQRDAKGHQQAEVFGGAQFFKEHICFPSPLGRPGGSTMP